MKNSERDHYFGCKSMRSPIIHSYYRANLSLIYFRVARRHRPPALEKRVRLLAPIFRNENSPENKKQEAAVECEGCKEVKRMIEVHLSVEISTMHTPRTIVRVTTPWTTNLARD